MEIGFYNISQGNCYNDEMATQENKFFRFSLNTFNLYKELQISKICLLKQLKHNEKYKLESQIIMKLKVKLLSCIRLFQTPWTVAHQAPPSTGFSRQECWSRLPFPSPGDLPDPGIEPRSPALLADTLTSEPPG